MTKGLQFDAILSFPTTINVLQLFPFNADFHVFSYRVLPETSRNLSNERLKLTHVNFIQRDSDADQLINVGSLVKNTTNHNRANLGEVFLNQSGKKVRICSFYMRSVKGMFQALFPQGYKRKTGGHDRRLIAN